MSDWGAVSRDIELRRTVYRTLAGAFAVFLFLFSPFSLIVIGWFADFEDSISHRVHEVAFGALFTVIFVGVLSQLGRPERQVAGLAQTMAATASLALVVSASTGPEIAVLAYVVPPLVLLVAHPDVGSLLRPRLRPIRGLLGAVAFAAIPMITHAWSNFDKALNRVQGHESHWGAMAAFGVTILLVTAVAGLGLPGWRLSAWSAGSAVAVYATVSLAFRFDASALSATQAIVALAWSAVVLVIAVRGRAGEAAIVRRMDDRLVAGVAAALARRRGMSLTWIRGAFVVVPLAGPIAYLALWAFMPATSRTEPRRSHTGPGRRIVALAAATGVALGATLLVSMWTSDRMFLTPVVPHQVERLNTSYCVTCHVGGAARGAPIITTARHPFEYPVVESCVSCHDHLPVAELPSAAFWRLGFMPPVVEDERP